MVDRPNVLFYVSDSLRADHVSCLGYDRETTPSVDSLAADGYRFENAFSQAIMTPSASVSILTGLYPETHGALTSYSGVPDGAPLLSERLREDGYRTAGFSTIPQVSRDRGFHAGFDDFEQLFEDHPMHDADPAALSVDAAIDWLDGGEDPFFAFVWSIGPHEPYRPRAGEFTEPGENGEIDGSAASLDRATFEDRDRVVDLYDDAIRHDDDQFGRLLAHLKETGRYEETIIVHTADHGELLSEHARLEHVDGTLQSVARRVAPSFCAEYKLFDRTGRVGHISALPYDELLHVPAVVKPAGGADGRRVEALVESIDLMPTVAELAGVAFDSQGTSLVDVAEGDRDGKEHVYSDSVTVPGIGRIKSVRSTDHKLVRNEIDWGVWRGSDYGSLPFAAFSVLRDHLIDSELLFDVAAGEDRNLRAERPETRRRLADRLEAWEGDTAGARAAYADAAASVSDDAEKQLRALGYK